MSIANQISIIVLEDSDEDYDTVQEAAKQSGLTNLFHRVISGDECLSVLRNEVMLRPTMVLMDLSTPGTDGRDTLAAIKQDPVLRSVPVVVLTTSHNPRDLQFCYVSGASAYHVKPIRYSEHLALLLVVLSYWLTSAILPHSGRQAL